MTPYTLYQIVLKWGKLPVLNAYKFDGVSKEEECTTCTYHLVSTDATYTTITNTTQSLLNPFKITASNQLDVIERVGKCAHTRYVVKYRRIF